MQLNYWPSQSVAELAELDESGLTGVEYKFLILVWCAKVLLNASPNPGTGGDGVNAASLSPPPLVPPDLRLNIVGIINTPVEFYINIINIINEVFVINLKQRNV